MLALLFYHLLCCIFHYLSLTFTVSGAIVLACLDLYVRVSLRLDQADVIIICPCRHLQVWGTDRRQGSMDSGLKSYCQITIRPSFTKSYSTKRVESDQ